MLTFLSFWVFGALSFLPSCIPLYPLFLYLTLQTDPAPPTRHCPFGSLSILRLSCFNIVIMLFQGCTSLSTPSNFSIPTYYFRSFRFNLLTPTPSVVPSFYPYWILYNELRPNCVIPIDSCI